MFETRGSAQNRRLSGVDASFIYLERKELPLHMAALCIFERPIPFDDFVRSVDSKLHLMPRCKQIVVSPPFNLGYPTWEDDPNFRIRRHIIRAHVAPPGGQAQLEELTGRVLTELMDRSRPLWDIHVIDGLENGGGALIVRVHHSMADGLAGVLFLTNVVLSPSPEVLPPGRKPRTRPASKPAAKPSLLGAVLNGIRSSVEHLVSAELGLLDVAQDLLTSPTRMAAAAGLFPEAVEAIERLPFNKPCRGGRKFCWADLDLADVQAIRAAAGGSVNDVVLTVLTRAIARYVEMHGQTVTRRLVRIVCPVNVRKDSGQSPGNQIIFMPVTLPLDVKDPVANLQAVAARTAMAKVVRTADLITIVASFLGSTPPPVQAAMWQGITHLSLPVPLFNMICSNLPGSPVPFYCLGSRMTAAYLQVPTGYELGINCVVQSYCGKLEFGFIADSYAGADVTRLRDFLCVAFEELCTATGVRKAARRAATRKARRAEPTVEAQPVAAESAPAEPAPKIRKRRPRRTPPPGLLPGQLEHATAMLGD